MGWYILAIFGAAFIVAVIIESRNMRSMEAAKHYMALAKELEAKAREEMEKAKSS